MTAVPTKVFLTRPEASIIVRETLLWNLPEDRLPTRRGDGQLINDG